MRIVASNPDGIGDLILRQPLYAAIQAAGHELLLLVRPINAELAPLVAPGCRFALIPGEPYSEQMVAPGELLDDVVGVVREFAPDVLLVAPYQRTLFEERLAERLTGVRVVGLAGKLFAGDLRGGFEWSSSLTFDLAVPAAEEEPELAKNRRLATQLLGREPPAAAPALLATDAQRALGRQLLGNLGMHEGEFVVACIGDHRYNAVRNWTVENWSAALAHWVNQHNRGILFVGSPEELDTTERVRAGMGAAGARTAVLADRGAPLDALLGVTAAGRAYIGRDTGPMHLAAALGLPVIAVFGGGNWPRFVPAPRAGYVATVGLACAGCDWVCPLQASYCVKQVPLEKVTSAIDALERGELSELRVEVLAPSMPLQARVVHELRSAAHNYQRRMHQRERELARLQTELERGAAESAQRLRELAAAAAEGSAAQEQRIARLGELLAAAQQRDLSLRAQQAELRDELLRAAAARHDGALRIRQLEGECGALNRAAQLAAESLQSQLAHWQHQAATYRQQMQDLRRSRWRKLGLRLGVARRAAWENGREPA